MNRLRTTLQPRAKFLSDSERKLGDDLARPVVGLVILSCAYLDSSSRAPEAEVRSALEHSYGDFPDITRTALLFSAAALRILEHARPSHPR